MNVVRYSSVRFLWALGALTTMGACATAGSAGQQQERTTLVVNNQGVVDMTIYALEGGSVRRRLGTAGAARATSFILPISLIGRGRDVQFVADPLPGTRAAVTERIYVYPGDQVTLTIPP